MNRNLLLSIFASLIIVSGGSLYATSQQYVSARSELLAQANGNATPQVDAQQKVVVHPPVPTSKTLEQLPDRELHLKSIHTNEEVSVIFWKDGAYVPEALEALNYLLRDHRTGDVIDIDPELFMIVHRLYNEVEASGPVHVISGHRSSKTNEMLRSKGRKVAKKSQHVLGKAIDIRMPGVPLKKMRDTALSYGLGGVGFYPNSDFVHVDTGKPRFW